MPDTGQSDGTWATYDLGGTVDTGTVYPTQFGQVITHRAPYNSGFYTLAEGPGLGFLLVYKTDVLTGTSSLILQIGTMNEANPANALNGLGIIASKTGSEVLVMYSDASYTAYFRLSSNGGGTFGAPINSTFGVEWYGLYMYVRLSTSPNAITLYSDESDGAKLHVSTNYGATSTDLMWNNTRGQITVLESHFSYSPIKIMALGAYAYKLDFSNGSHSPLVNLGLSAPWQPILSFGSAIFDGSGLGLALESPQESYWDPNTDLGGYPANAFDCYGDPIDKSAGPLENGVTANSIIFNEDGTMGWYPIRTWDFLINTTGGVGVGNQFFTAFQKTIETNFRPP